MPHTHSNLTEMNIAQVHESSASFKYNVLQQQMWLHFQNSLRTHNDKISCFFFLVSYQYTHTMSTYLSTEVLFINFRYTLNAGHLHAWTRKKKSLAGKKYKSLACQNLCIEVWNVVYTCRWYVHVDYINFNMIFNIKRSKFCFPYHLPYISQCHLKIKKLY